MDARAKINSWEGLMLILHNHGISSFLDISWDWNTLQKMPYSYFKVCLFKDQESNIYTQCYQLY